MLKKINFYTFLILFTFCSSCSLKNSDAKEQLIVAMDLDMPGYFTLNGETFGYQYEMLSEYAEYLGFNLKVISENAPATYQAMLSDNKIDMAVVLKTHITDKTNIAIPVYNTSYVVLTGRKNARSLKKINNTNIYDVLSDKKVLIAHGFSTSKSYNQLLDSVKNSETFLSSRNSFELIGALSEGDYDYLICEQSEAHLGCALVRNISQVYDFNEDIPVYILFNKKDAAFAQSFASWKGSFNQTDKYVELNKLYFEKGIASKIISRGLREKSKGGISVFDEIIKSISKRENIDWRLVSAIAYNESKFNPYIVSPSGARGLMQIMPSVAREFNMPKDSVMNPEHNIMLGIKLINKLERILKFGDKVDFKNKMSIILACYNGGIGHVMDARNLAFKYGANPDSWSDVSHYLKLKSQSEFAEDEVVKNGRFSGTSETVAFVSNVLAKYNSYCSRVKN